MAGAHPPTVMTVFAHPDDEAFSTGGTLARYARDGRAVVVCATRGELGEISDPALARPETLGEVREQELRDACAVLGVEDVRFLGYRDSGMAGAPGNQDPRSLAQARVEDVAARLVPIFREVRPDVVITFEETGGYGHPDHIAIHYAATRAFELAADPSFVAGDGAPIVIPRLLYAGIPRSRFRHMFEQARAANLDLGSFAERDPNEMGVPDELIDVEFDVAEFVALKRRALEAHRTQMGDGSLVRRVPDDFWNQWLAREFFLVARGNRPSRPVDDLHSEW